MTHATGETAGGTFARHNDEMSKCIQECATCHATCLTTVLHCLEKGGKHAAPNHIRLLLDCAQICQTSADFMLRGSPLHARTCGACAAVCTECASDCEQLGEDQVMRQCAEVCRRCAESCERMSVQAH